MANWLKIFTDLLLRAHCAVHQVKILVFDNYQRCPVPLKDIHGKVLSVLEVGTASQTECKECCGFRWHLTLSIYCTSRAQPAKSSEHLQLEHDSLVLEDEVSQCFEPCNCTEKGKEDAHEQMYVDKFIICHVRGRRPTHPSIRLYSLWRSEVQVRLVQLVIHEAGTFVTFKIQPGGKGVVWGKGGGWGEGKKSVALRSPQWCSDLEYLNYTHSSPFGTIWDFFF